MCMQKSGQSREIEWIFEVYQGMKHGQGIKKTISKFILIYFKSFTKYTSRYNMKMGIKVRNHSKNVS